MVKVAESRPNSIVLTGDRPTGPLHLGHFVGSLKSRLELQNVCNQFIIIADLQGLTDNASNPDLLVKNRMELMYDYLSVGLDPGRNTFFVQSKIPALCEITFYYMNLVTIARLQRNPTVKQEIIDKGFEESLPAGFLCHPVSQAADITAFQADLVPVGEDQKPLIEQTNEIVRKFNMTYGDGAIKEVRPLLSDTPRLIGIDGHSKASKSKNNTIFLSDDDEALRTKVYSMYTDPDHIRVTDPGKVEGNVVFAYLDAFYHDKNHLADLKSHYTRGGLGDIELKKLLFNTLKEFLDPIRINRSKITVNMVQSILAEHNKVANQVANNTLGNIRCQIGLD